MVSSIKINTGKDFDWLLNHPDKLISILKVAVGRKEEVNKEDLEYLMDVGIITKEGVKQSLLTTNLKRTKADTIANLSLTAMQRSSVPNNEIKYYEIALAFHQLIKSNLEGIGARTSQLNGATYKAWVQPIRLMIEQDKVTTDEFREVWGFLKGHPFWSANIQSTDKLRKQFATLHSQFKANGAKKSTSENQQPGARTVSSNYVNGIFKDLQS